MKILISILLLLSFIQSTMIQLDLVFIVLTLRSFIRVQKVNLFLAFGFGLLLSHLSNTPFGIYSLVYLILVEVSHLFSKSPFSQQIVSVVALVSLLYLVRLTLLSLALGGSIQLWPESAMAGLISLPFYFIVRFWEERFVVRDIKLRV